MSRIRSKGNTRTEIAFIKLMQSARIVGWRRNSKIFGRPDFVFSKYKIAIFIDGCFWHGCPIHADLPLTNTLFWKEKFNKNAARDTLVNTTLKNRGWYVLRFWQHDLSKKRSEEAILRLKEYLG